MKTLLDEYRDTIAALDDSILKFLNLRMHYCWFIGKHKRENNLPIENAEVEAAIKERLKEAEEFPGLVDIMWDEIFKFSKEIQKEEK